MAWFKMPLGLGGSIKWSTSIWISKDDALMLMACHKSSLGLGWGEGATATNLNKWTVQINVVKHDLWVGSCLLCNQGC